MKKLFARDRILGLVSALLMVSMVGAARADEFTMPGGDTSLQFVTIGNPGNAADSTTYGSVSSTYKMSTNDVTAAQYALFLNSVATTADPEGLYNINMSSAVGACGITQTASAGGYTYAITGNPNYPVNNVTWGDAARFCNWLQNGQLTAPEGLTTTETGAYTLNNDITTLTESRNTGAKYYIPSENEWYKAAYYDPALNSGAGGYWTYPTRNNSAPSNVMSSAGTNNANYNNGVYTDPTNYLTTVGYFTGSPGAYGTFDMGGDVEQWTDTTFGTRRIARGASFSDGSSYLASSTRNKYSPTSSNSYIGFRVADAVTAGGSSSFSLSGTAASYNMLINGTEPLNGTVSNAASAGLALANWTVTATANGGAFSPSTSSGTNVAIGGTVPVAFNWTAPSSAGSYNIGLTGTGDSVAGSVGPLAINVGYATAASQSTSGSNATFSGGTSLQASVAASASYANLAAIVNGDLNTQATMISGSNSSPSTPENLAMVFRLRAQDEVAGSAPGKPFLISDVVQVSGLNIVSGSQTDPYVLQMSYNVSALPGGSSEASTAFSSGGLFLAAMPGSAWERASTALSSTGTHADDRSAMTGNSFDGFNGSFATFLSDVSSDFYSGGAVPLSAIVGAHGVDLSTGNAWAVVNYQGQFAVVPEPGSIAMLCAGAAGLLLWIRRRKA